MGLDAVEEGASPKDCNLAAVFKVTRFSADCYDHHSPTLPMASATFLAKRFR